jgi:hypothetical protein
MGFNRTGVSTSPKLTKEMVQGTKEFAPSSAGDEREIAALRMEYAKAAEPLGHVPPPLTVKGAMKGAVQAIKGEPPAQLTDKLGERLGFERMGVRLYTAIVSKFDIYGGFPGGPSKVELEKILSEEYEHFKLLEGAVMKLGGDPTVMTPSADLQATMNRGVLEVVVEPRTDFVQCLEAALIAELADNDAWEMLSQLARQAGEEELAASFDRALLEEREHLIKVRAWLAAAQGRTEIMAE